MSSIPTSTSTSRAARSPLRSRRGRAGLAGGAVLLAALPLLAACSAGSDPEVYKIIPDNGNAKAGDMWISNVWVVFDPTTRNAEVIGQVANTNASTTSSQTLTAVAISGAAATLVQPANPQLSPGVSVSGDSVVIPGLKSVEFGQPGQPELDIANADVTLGANTIVTYTFSNGQKANVVAIVQPSSGQFAQFNPNGANSASPLPSPTGGVATGTPTPSGSLAGGTGAPATGTAAAGDVTGTAKATGGSTPTATASSSAGH